MSEGAAGESRPAGGEEPDDAFRDWSALHGDASATGVVRIWLRLVYRLARPLVVAGVSPNLVTVTGLLVGALAVVPAALGQRLLLLSSFLVVLSALLDGLDGAVAVLASRVSRAGSRLDHACDRSTEICFAACLWLAGGTWFWCLAGVGLALAHESTRGWARLRGMTSVGIVTVSERPTRVLVVAMFLLGAGMYPAAAAVWATTGAVVMTVAGAIGLVQLILVVRRVQPAG